MTGPLRRAEAVTTPWAASAGHAPGAAGDGPDAGSRDAGSPAVGGAAGDGPELVLNLGPGHPSGHGLLRLRLVLDGDRVVTAEPVIGYVHRGAEKLFEVRDYRQIIVLANRHDWLGAFASELGVVLAAERLAGIEVPPRGVWARTLLAELNRALSHLAFLASYPPEIAGLPPGAGATAAAAARELLQSVMEEVSGGRMHYMFNRVGGLKEELPAGWAGCRLPRPRSAAACRRSARSWPPAMSSAAGRGGSACSARSRSGSTG